MAQMKKADLIKILVEKYGYEKEDIKMISNAKLQGLIKQEEEDLKIAETDSTRVLAKKTGLKDNDKIVIMSGQTGSVGYFSERSNKRWQFNSFGQEDLMEYSELVAMKNKYPAYLNEGWIIVLDKEVQEEFKLTEMYKNILTPDNIEEVFKMNVETLEKFVDALPEGMKTSFVSKANEKYEDGTLDSIQVIKFIQNKFNFSFEDNAPLNDIVLSTDTGVNNIIYVDKK